jgi:DNA gyrase subunit A
MAHDDDITPAERALIDPGQEASRLHVVDGYLAAFDRLEEIGQTVRWCRTRSQAAAALTAPAFGFSDVQAQHILDLSFAHQTEERRLALVTERDDLRRRLGDRGLPVTS